MSRALRASGSAAVVLLMALPFQASATSSVTNLQVTATISTSCTISTGSAASRPVDAPVTNLSTPLRSAGAIRTTCTGDTNAVITLAPGGGADAMALHGAAKGFDTMAYALPPDSSRTFVWGAAPSAASERGATSEMPADGRPEGDPASVRTDSSTIVATVTF